MNEFRSALHDGRLSSNPVASKEERRRQRHDGASLSGLLIPRVERRTTNQRREDRYRGVVDRATVVFRRKKLLVKVCNVSESGVMVEAAIEPRIGEQVKVVFDGFEPLQAVVRWVRDGRIGLDVGDGAISLG
jgi:hypothetical protein